MDERRNRTDSAPLAGQTCFFTLIKSVEEEWNARLLIESLRAFGGQWSHCPVWVFLPDPANVSRTYAGLEDVHFVPLVVEEKIRHDFFAGKVSACARAEEMADRDVRSLVWLSPQCFIVNPPVLFDLPPSFDAAFRPVHVKNVGSPAQEPLDDFWQGVYRTVGVDDVPFTVESFVDSQKMRPYFNTHAFSINPARKVLRTWLECFKTMVSDRGFQAGPCRDEGHQIFLHQAIVSTLVAKLLDWERIRVLPPEYSYPLHFHLQVPQARRPQALNSLVCPVYEETFRYPDTLNGIEVDEPLRSWLVKRTPAQSGP